MLFRALAELGSSSKSIVFVIDYQGGPRIQSRSPMEGDHDVWGA